MSAHVIIEFIKQVEEVRPCRAFHSFSVYLIN